MRACLAVTTVLALFFPVGTSFAAATVSLSSSSGAIGSAITVSGGGFAANTAVRILFGGLGGTQVGSESTDGSGNLPGMSVTVPSVTGGTYQIFATDGSNTASANFSVPFSLTVSPESGGPGTGITVAGTGFLAGEGVSVGWDQAGNQLATASANAGGAFSAGITAPNGSGNHVVFATGTSSHFMLATTFALNAGGNVGGANLVLNRHFGMAGNTVNLSGSGFGASEQVNLTVDGNALTSVTSDMNGNIATTVTLASSLAPGEHTIAASGVTSGHSASAVFTVRNAGCTDGNTRRGSTGFGDRNNCRIDSGRADDDRRQDDRRGQEGDNDNQGHDD